MSQYNQARIEKAKADAAAISKLVLEYFPSFTPSVAESTHQELNPSFYSGNTSIHLKSIETYSQGRAFQINVRVGYGKTRYFPQKKDGTFSWDKIKEYLEEETNELEKRLAKIATEQEIEAHNRQLLRDKEFKKVFVYPSKYNKDRVSVTIPSSGLYLSIEQAEKLDKFLQELTNG